MLDVGVVTETSFVEPISYPGGERNVFASKPRRCCVRADECRTHGPQQAAALVAALMTQFAVQIVDLVIQSVNRILNSRAGS